LPRWRSVEPAAWRCSLRILRGPLRVSVASFYSADIQLHEALMDWGSGCIRSLLNE
jgi:hypothetical protein